MMKRLAVSVFGAFLLASCHGTDLGTGLNTIDREYSRPAPEMLEAALKSVKSADFKLVENRHDEFGGEVVSQRANGSEVHILVKSLDARSSRVSVRVEPGDRDLATMLQEQIAENVGLGMAKVGIFGGNSLEANYRGELSTLTKSARHAFTALEVTTTDEEIHASWVALNGRLKDSTPVRIRINKIEEFRARVIFIVGSEKSEDNRGTVQRLKEEFERSTPSEGSGH